MIKPELYQYIQAAASLLASELEKSRQREQKLEFALKQHFPFDLYKRLRPDVVDSCDGDLDSILNHYIEHGVSDLNFKDKIDKLKNFTATKQAKSCLINSYLPSNLGNSYKSKNQNRELIKTLGNHSSIAVNAAYNFASKFTLSHSGNSVCTWIPNNGLSNLRYSVALANGAIAGVDEIDSLHDSKLSLSADNREILMADYTYVFLRNPFTRLLSFFIDTLCQNGPTSSIDSSYINVRQIFNFSESTSFSDFVQFIWDNPDAIYYDIRTRPQADYLIYRTYDDYFALENYQIAVQKIFDETGLQIRDIRNYHSIYTTKDCLEAPEITHASKSSDIAKATEKQKKYILFNMYTSEMTQKVASLYLQDILLYLKHVNCGHTELQYWVERAI